MSYFRQLTRRKGMEWVWDNLCYETTMGSVVHGANTAESDLDLIGYTIPPWEYINPYLDNKYLPGFSRTVPNFEQTQIHHINGIHPTSRQPGPKCEAFDDEVDITVYSIQKYFSLCMDANPNMIDSMFTHPKFWFYKNQVHDKVYENRHLFLHKGAYHRFKGYSYSQMSKIKNKSNSTNPKRAALIEKYSYDTKYAMHLVRLMLECEQILEHHDLDLQCDATFLKSIRSGHFATLDELIEWSNQRENKVNELYVTSKLQDKPDEPKILKLLLEVIGDFHK